MQKTQKMLSAVFIALFLITMTACGGGGGDGFVPIAYSGNSTLATIDGTNAGDFAGINVIDLQLGLCFANEPSYSQMLVDKFLYMMPEDQIILRDCMRRSSIMDDFLAVKACHKQSWYSENLSLFLEVCKLHGETAIQHHEQLVEKYIAQAAGSMAQKHMDKVTASGPPLQVLLSSLEKLKDRRAALKRGDIRTRFDDICTLKASLR